MGWPINFLIHKGMLDRTPIFIPKLPNKTMSEWGVHLPAAIVEALVIFWRPKTIDAIREFSDAIIIDPITHQMLFKESSEKKNFKKIGYPEEVNQESIYSNSEYRKNHIIVPAVNVQIEAGADFIVAPYFHAEDTDSIRFGVNITLITETLRYLEEIDVSKPVLAKIFLGKGVLERKTEVNYIVDRYRDDFSEKLFGYILVFDKFDGRSASEDSLLNLAEMGFQLSEKGKVIYQHMGSFGEVLCAIGMTGFSSGLGDGDSITVEHLESSPAGFNNKTKKTYIPEIFYKMNDEAVKQIGYSCDCPACSGSRPLDNISKKKHFFYRKDILMNALANMEKSERVDFMRSLLYEGIERADRYNREYGLDIKTNHLRRWLAVLELMEHWTYEEDDNLDELLEELERPE